MLGYLRIFLVFAFLAWRFDVSVSPVWHCWRFGLRVGHTGYPLRHSGLIFHCVVRLPQTQISGRQSAGIQRCQMHIRSRRRAPCERSNSTVDRAPARQPLGALLRVWRPDAIIALRQRYAVRHAEPQCGLSRVGGPDVREDAVAGQVVRSANGPIRGARGDRGPGAAPLWGVRRAGLGAASCPVSQR